MKVKCLFTKIKELNYTLKNDKTWGLSLYGNGVVVRCINMNSVKNIVNMLHKQREV